MNNAIVEARDNNFNLFIGQNSVSNCIDNSIKSIDEYIENLDDTNIKYEIHLWFSLHKKIHSGMHFDERSKLLYVLSGRKKVLLLPPSNKKDIYLEKFNLINTMKKETKIKNNNNSNIHYLLNYHFLDIIFYFKFEVIICILIIIFKNNFSKLF
jgi:hypothetical protein